MARPKVSPPPQASADEIEQQFYDALQRGDLELLMSLWADDDEIVCVHPGGPRVVGAAAIRATFDSLFSNGTIEAHPESVHRMNTHACAVHSVLEQIRVLTDGGPQTAWVTATNVYVQTALGWRIAAHHASPGSVRETHERVEAGSTLH